MNPSMVGYVTRIGSVVPDLDLSDARLETEGLANDVVFVGGQVWRFARDEGSARKMEREVGILERLRDPRSFEYVPRIIHGDLAPYHILFDPRACQVCGVIDFGTAGAGDPANDLACLLQAFGGEFVSGVLGAYPELGEAMPRARYYCQMLELGWVMQGLKYGQPFWFTAHLGNARDLGSGLLCGEA